MTDQPEQPPHSRRTTLRLQAVPAEQVPRESASRRLVQMAILVLLATLVWVLTRPPPTVEDVLAWSDIAPPASTPIHPWRWIVIHHSATRRSSSQEIDREHQEVRGWDGIGYHFVIGNGADMPLGRIDATYRWRTQTHGAHAGPNPQQAPYNSDGIGICLIGNFDLDSLNPFQERRLVELCALLINDIPTLSVSRIIGHRDVPGKATVCPGRNVDIERLRFLVREEMLARHFTVR
jgi:N-acetyl-anhydromuramyl-L-alanine amidase AmpD